MNGLLKKITLSTILATLISGCASGPEVPNWKTNSARQLNAYGIALLEGDKRKANIAYKSARRSISSTGNLELAARLEIAKCGYLLATTTPECFFSREHPYFKYASEKDLSFLNFINGTWTNINQQKLETKYSNLIKVTDNTALTRNLQSISDPISKLIASSALHKKGKITPEIIQYAIVVSSEQGLRNSLEKWLYIALKDAHLSKSKTLTDKYKAQLHFLLENESR